MATATHCSLLLIFSFLATAAAASFLHVFCVPPKKFQLIWVLSSNSQPTIQPEGTDTTSHFIATMQTSSFVCSETRLVRTSRVQLNEFRINSMRTKDRERQSVVPSGKQSKNENGQNYHEMISCPVVYVRKHIFSTPSSSSFLLGK